jgi:hypothetical protein
MKLPITGPGDRVAETSGSSNRAVATNVKSKVPKPLMNKHRIINT